MGLKPTHRVYRYEEIPLEKRRKYYEDYPGWGKCCTLLGKVGRHAEIVLEEGTLKGPHLIHQDLLFPLPEQNWLWT